MYFSFSWIYIYYLRPIVKWFLRKTTTLCELQRICYGKISGASRILGVERSLNLSKTKQIKQLVIHLNDVADNKRFIHTNEKELVRGAISTVLLIKKINPQIHYQFVRSFGKCVEQIWGYRQLIAEVELLRLTQFDTDYLEHEMKLNRLWDNLMPQEKLEGRVSKQWQIIGFQGNDPKTDFRGMGMLGLDNLLYFSTEFKQQAQQALSHSMHPTHGYCFAIVGINLTAMAWNLLKDGTAKPFFYDTCKISRPTIGSFHSFYSYIFYEFDRFWVQNKPKNIMEFSSVKSKFEKNIRVFLTNPNSNFKISLAVVEHI